MTLAALASLCSDVNCAWLEVIHQVKEQQKPQQQHQEQQQGAHPPDSAEVMAMITRWLGAVLSLEVRPQFPSATCLITWQHYCSVVRLVNDV